MYDKVPVAECWKNTGKAPIGTKWLDSSKGDEKAPNHRSRCVAKEIAYDKQDGLFAATPPLEAKKALFSLAVTEGIGFERGMRKSGMKIEFIDIRRAYFHSEARRPLYVQLPGEDYEEGKCGRLNKAVYGTRDAAQNWEVEYNKFLADIGFKRGISSPCTFYHEERNLRLVVHGDDFVSRNTCSFGLILN